jgi:hypothetical protein
MFKWTSLCGADWMEVAIIKNRPRQEDDMQTKE